jgi:hypothetical protein
MNEGNSMEYAAGVYSLPVKTFDAYLSGLWVEPTTNIAEIKTGNIEPPSFAYDVAKADAKDNDAFDPLPILPYMIVATGDFFQPDYQVIGKDLDLTNSPKFGLYVSAYEHAILCLDCDKKLAKVLKNK